MEYTRATARAMHEDHMAVLGLLERLDQLLVRHSGDTLPDCTQGDARLLLNDLKAAVHSEITSHFDFEEKSLFPIICEAGADDMADILKTEHSVLLPLGSQLADMAGTASLKGFTRESWMAFRQTAGAFVEGLSGHVDKEEMALVPALEEILDEQQDMELITSYRFN